LGPEELSNPWNAIGIRMLRQLLNEDIDAIHDQYVASPRAIFQLVATAEKIDLYEDFTGILVVDGVQKTRTEYDDGENKESGFYGLLNQIGGLSLMSRTVMLLDWSGAGS